MRLISDKQKVSTSPPRRTGKIQEQNRKTLKLKCLLVSFSIRVLRELELLYIASKNITYQHLKKKWRKRLGYLICNWSPEAIENICSAFVIHIWFLS